MPRASRLSVLIVAFAAAVAGAAERHVVLVVCDGLRPDFLSAQTMPNLWALAQSGVFFSRHHPVYPSATEVNGTALATGAYPAHSTLIGNKEYRPGIDPEKPVGMEWPAVIRRGDEVAQDHYLAWGTVAEFLHAHGLRTAVAGAKQVALLADRCPRPDDSSASPVVYEGAAMPARLQSTLAAALGAFPPADRPAPDAENKIRRDAWTTHALLDVLWRDGVPDFSLLWLAEPDCSQHANGPGSPQALAAIKSSDDNLGLVLAELDRRGLRSCTDVLVVSDHGFSTILRAIHVAADLAGTGINVLATVPRGGLAPGQVLLVNNGGTVFFYVGGHDAAVCRRLAAQVQTQDWAGIVFTRAPAEGAFGLADGHLDSPEAPDVVVSLRWSPDRSAIGTSGLICAEGSERAPGQGQHGTLGATDMHNTLVAAGPGFRVGLRDLLPSGNVDVAPTILWLLGFKDEAAHRDGRVLGEAIVGDVSSPRPALSRRLTARRHLDDGRTWEQYLYVSDVNGVQYFDGGDGAQVPAR